MAIAVAVSAAALRMSPHITKPMSPQSARRRSQSHCAKFYSLLRTATMVIQEHGPYTTLKGTTVFARASRAPMPGSTPSLVDVAQSFAAAQDCFESAQPDGPARDDLDMFTNLWNVTIALLEDIAHRKYLNPEALGWGAFGIASGYMSSAKPEVPRKSVALYKDRLHAALLMLPSIHRRNRGEYDPCGRISIDVLVTARKEVHMCTTLLLQRFKEEDWQRVRWWHVVSVTDRWLRSLGYVEIAEDNRQEKETWEAFCFP